MSERERAEEWTTGLLVALFAMVDGDNDKAVDGLIESIESPHDGFAAICGLSSLLQSCFTDGDDSKRFDALEIVDRDGNYVQPESIDGSESMVLAMRCLAAVGADNYSLAGDLFFASPPDVAVGAVACAFTLAAKALKARGQVADDIREGR